MKMMCPHCNIEMIMGFEPMGYNQYGIECRKKINGRDVYITPVACYCPKCKKIEWYAYTPKSKADDYKNLY